MIQCSFVGLRDELVMYSFTFTKCENTTFGMVKLVSPCYPIYITYIHKGQEERRIHL